MRPRNNLLRVSRIPATVAVAILILTTVPFFFTRHLANIQDRRALTQKADTERINITTLIAQQRLALRSLGTALQQDASRPDAFAVDANQVLASNTSGYKYFALVNTQTNPPTIVSSAGTSADPGVATMPRFQQAIKGLSVEQPLTTTGVLHRGAQDYVALVVGPPVAPPGHAIYGEIDISPHNAAVVEATLGVHSDIDSALYSGAPTPQNLIVASTTKLPLTGKVVNETTLVGTSQWRLIVRERHPVADALTRAVPWIILGAGVLIALLSGFAVNTLVRRRDDALLLAKERSQENVSILEAAQEAFISTSIGGTILRWSAQAERLFGYKADDVLGKQLIETIIPERLRESQTSALRRYIESDHKTVPNQRIEADAVNAEGVEFPVEMTLWMATTRAMGQVTFNAIAHDITERRRAAENLAAVTQRALEASQLKSEFLANMSHEIRTPMNGVIGMASLLLDSELTAEQHEQAHVVQKSAESLLNVINDILDFSKIEAGRLEIEKSNFNVRQLIEELPLLFATLAKQKGLDLRVEIAPDVPRVVHGDEGRLRQVLLNIVGNAIKFTSTGWVSIRCERDSTQAGDRLHFEVTDTGIGIAPESLERLFESFVQVDMSSTRRHEGTGLGLAISSRLVALMQGEIGVRSEPGKGSTFWFSIVVEQATSKSSTKHQVNAAELNTTMNAPRVLVVEDNLVNQRVAALTLERLGCTVYLVDDGTSATEAVQNEHFDLIFMDCQMPGMDGYEATRRIRSNENPERRNTIIAMTASAMQGDRERALDAGMDDYLAKPVKIEDFVAVISKWFGDGTTEAVHEEVASAEIDVDLRSLEELRERTASNPAIYTGIINTYITQTEDLISDIQAASAAGDREALAKFTHKLRGSSATVGALAVARLCTDIDLELADNHISRLPQLIEKLDAALRLTRQVFENQISDMSASS